MRFLDFKDQFYAPVWIRVCVVAVCVGWGFLEVSNAAYGWAAVFLGLGAYAAWQFATIDYAIDDEDV